MKTEHIQQLLEKMSPKHKDYDFVMTMLAYGHMGHPISVTSGDRVIALLDEYKIKWRPNVFKKYYLIAKLWWDWHKPMKNILELGNEEDYQEQKPITRTEYQKNLKDYLKELRSNP